MSDIDKIMEVPKEDGVLDQKSELTSSTDENGENVVSATAEAGSLEIDEVGSMGLPAIQQRVKELYSTIKDLVSQMRLQDSDDHTEVGQQNIDYYDLTQIQNMKVDKLQEHLLQRGEMCRKLLADLKIQEQVHLSEIEKLNQKLRIKDEYCLELKEKMEQLHRECKPGCQEDMLKKDDIIQKLSTVMKNQDIEIEKLKERSKIMTAKNIQLRTYVLKKDETNQKLLTDIKKQEQTHLMEIAKLKQFKTDREELMAQPKLNRIFCSICQAPCTLIGYHRLVSLECGHLFGYQCISECLQENRCCPQCKAIAYEDEIRFLKIKINKLLLN